MNTLAELEGRWLLRREITDIRAGLTGRLDGESIWSPSGAGFLQRERGVLQFGSAPPMKAERAYLWQEKAGRLVLSFEDGRFFHEFTPAEPKAEHLCGADLYRVAYDFSGWPVWRSRWKVTGPRKELVIANRFERAPDQ